jgi:ABC-type nickel/cobalt efflux system permease component RcnA
MVPCPGTIILVVFLSSLGLFYVGLASVLFIILGMGITIMVVVLMSMFSKKLVLKMVSVDSDTYAKFYRIISNAGALLLVALGLFFFYTSFQMTF